jgi:uncharacterized protein involved in exopolysaccharide biosynthesis
MHQKKKKKQVVHMTVCCSTSPSKTTDVQKLREKYMNAVKHRNELSDEFVDSLKSDLDEAREAKRFIEAELEEHKQKIIHQMTEQLSMHTLSLIIIMQKS